MNRTELDEEYKERILESLGSQPRPLDVESIRVEAEIGNWNTALKHCLELLIQGKIRGQKTSKSWVFWVENSERRTYEEEE